MKHHILPAIKLTFILFIFFAVIYPALIWVGAQAAPNKGKGEISIVNGKVVGYTNEGQSFTLDKYFWSRPSAVGYNAAGSGGSNKGPNNEAYLKEVNDRLDSFLVHNPGVRKEQVPADLVTASGSGLDPDISPEAAYIQVARIAKNRALLETDLKKLIDKSIEKPLAGLFGTSKINVLKLNIALDNLKK